MSIVAIFDSQLSPEQYGQIIEGLSAAGLDAPDGRLHHAAWATPEGWRVVDIWESEEKLGKFAEVLMPLMADLGLSVPPPKIYQAHNVISGA